MGLIVFRVLPALTWWANRVSTLIHVPHSTPVTRVSFAPTCYLLRMVILVEHALWVCTVMVRLAPQHGIAPIPPILVMQGLNA